MSNIGDRVLIRNNRAFISEKLGTIVGFNKYTNLYDIILYGKRYSYFPSEMCIVKEK